MATRSTISVRHKDGTYESVYCHFDGYIMGVGKKLLRYYNTYEKVVELVSLGNLSSLSETIPNSSFYCRDENESFSSNFFINEVEFSNANFQQCNYLFKNNKWWHIHPDLDHLQPLIFTPLSELIEKKESENE